MSLNAVFLCDYPKGLKLQKVKNVEITPRPFSQAGGNQTCQNRREDVWFNFKNFVSHKDSPETNLGLKTTKVYSAIHFLAGI